MRIEQDRKIDFKDVLIRPKRSTLSSRSEVALERTYELKAAGRTWSGIPIIAANMDTIGTLSMAEALARHGCLTALHKFFSIDDLSAVYAQQGETLAERIFVTIGATAKDLEFITGVRDAIADKAGQAMADRMMVCIDVANGYQEAFVEFVRSARRALPKVAIMAGNVVTGEMVEELLISGADIVKCGIGGGSVCTTRRVTGVGYPQLSAVIECADAAHGLGGLMCSDGGCTVPGDLAKAFGGGADFVMLGGMLAGHDECAGELVDDDSLFSANDPAWTAAWAAMTDDQRARLQGLIPSGKRMKFYGMSSDTAMTKHYGGVASYRASEGKTVTVPYRGPVDATMQEILGGLRSACTYVGAKRLKELSKRTTFVYSTIQTNDVFGTR